MLPWNLVLPWYLIRRLRGQREDAAGLFLHTWWFSIFGVFVVAVDTRAVYLLPMYPAIALLAARATAVMFPRSQRASDFESLQKSPLSRAPRLLRRPAKGLGIGIALLDLGFMLVNPTIWKDTQLRKSRLAFIERIAAAVPSHRPLFAAPELRNTDRMIIAYRLGRKIDRKPMTSANENDYFLSPSESINLSGDRTEVLAVSAIDKIALVTIPSKFAA